MGRIVVGVDGSQNSLAALRRAVEEARLKGSTVHAVMAWHPPYVGGPVPVPIDNQVIEDSHRAQLDRIVAGTDARDLEQPIEAILVEGTASRALLDCAQGADQIVVGSRGHGGLMGLILGSVSTQVAGHAECPVTVVPAVDDAS